MTLDEFINNHLDSAQREFPADAEDVLQKNARKMVKALKNNSPDNGKKGRHKIKNSWKLEMKGLSSETLRAEIHSTSPHFHLIERGHVQKNKSGQVVGFVQGQYFTKKTVNEESAGLKTAMGEQLFNKLKVKF